MKVKLNCILLVDDDEPTNFLNKIAIEEVECTHQIKVIPGAREALDYLSCAGQPAPKNKECPTPEIIFLDINMPAMDGWEFLEKYRQLPQAQKASIVMIMLTTSLNPDDQQRAGAIPEIDGFEHKPLRIDRLKEVLKNYFPDRV